MEFINENEICLVTFSAVWCGPCKGSKPKLQGVAKGASIPFGYVHEGDLEDFLDIFVEIKAFPTYICFKGGKEMARVEGVNFPALEEMLLTQASNN